MDFKEITSRDNALVKHIAKLQTSARYRAENREFVAEGLRICKDCIDNGVQIKTLVLTSEFAEKFPEQAAEFAEKAQEKVVVPNAVFGKISDTKTPQGILIIGEIPKKSATDISVTGRYVALENIADPSNLGAVARTAEALGVDGIILSGNGCDPYSPKALRASMGTLLRMPVFVFDNFVSDLKNTDLKLYACVVSGGEIINTVAFAGGSAVLIGNEANGLTDAAVSVSEKVTIPMRGKAESLNAAVAASIALWELMQ